MIVRTFRIVFVCIMVAFFLTETAPVWADRTPHNGATRPAPPWGRVTTGGWETS